MAALIGIGAPYENLLISGSPLSFDHSTPAAVLAFLLFSLLINPLLGALKQRWRFDPAELITVYIMGAVACTLPTLGLVCRLLPQISAGGYFATPGNRWEREVLPHFVSWLQVTDERALKWFYEGIPQNTSIPWGAWLKPLAAWAPLLLATVCAMTAMMVLIRKQWVRHERLNFPLMQLPAALVGSPDTSGDRLLRSWPALLGIALPLAMYSLRGLHHYFPEIPEGMPIWRYYFLWDDQFRLRLSLSYAVVGFGYLLSTKLGFSIWFLGLLTSLQHAVLLEFGLAGTQRVAGTALGSSHLVYQGFGAMVVLVAYTLWIARPHLLEAWRIARKRTTADSDEIISYRQAYAVLGVSIALIMVWFYLAGMSWWLVPVVAATTFVLLLGITRIVAEGGLAVAKPPIMIGDVAMGAFGTQTLGASNIAGLGLANTWAGEMRITPMTAVIHGLRLAEEYIKKKQKRLFLAIIGAAGISTACAVVTVLNIGYSRGSLNLSFWFFGASAATAPYAFASYHLAAGAPWSWEFSSVAGLGALIQLLLTLAHKQFLWWPLHPIAFPVSAIWTTHHLMPSIFVAWVIKVVVLRTGGIQLYSRIRPFFLGLIVGQYGAGGLWLAIDGFTGATGNYLFFW